jgi:hypothetical protein
MESGRGGKLSPIFFEFRGYWYQVRVSELLYGVREGGTKFFIFEFRGYCRLTQTQTQTETETETETERERAPVQDRASPSAGLPDTYFGSNEGLAQLSHQGGAKGTFPVRPLSWSMQGSCKDQLRARAGNLTLAPPV